MRSVRLAMALVVIALLTSANCFADDFFSLRDPGADFLTPAPHQIDIEADDAYMFTVGSNTLRRRINSFPDSAISLQHDLGVSQLQLTETLLSYWFDSVNAVQFQFRYYGIYGSKFETQPLAFGGTIISPNQKLNPGGTRWYTFGGYYERRLTPLYQNYEANLPECLQGWDSRAKIGLEFTYNDFRINDGSPLFSQVSPFEARIRFHDKGLADTGDRTRGASSARLQLRVRGNGAGLLGQQVGLRPQRGRRRFTTRSPASRLIGASFMRAPTGAASPRSPDSTTTTRSTRRLRRASATCCACSCSVPKSASTGVSEPRVEIIAGLKRAAE